MAKKNSDRKSVLRHFSNYVDEEFFQNCASVLEDDLGMFALAHSRIGCIHYDVLKSAEKSRIIKIDITDGLTGLFPFLPEGQRVEYDRKYFSQMDSLKAEFGDDPEKWSANAKTSLGNGYILPENSFFHAQAA